MTGEAWDKKSGRRIPEVFSGDAERKAGNRLLFNWEASMDDVLEPNLEATAERCRSESAVLAIQGTTTLNYKKFEDAEDFVSLGEEPAASVIAAHFCLAVSEDGRPLGVLSLEADFCGKGLPESGRWLDGLKRADEFARACTGVRTVAVCDKEGDNWDLLRKAANGRVELLVHASSKRRVRLLDGGSEDLRDFMSAQPVMVEAVVGIDGRGGARGRKAREAKLEIRAARVALVPPGKRPVKPDLQMLAVFATETNPPARTESITWLLLASHGDACAEDALTVVRRYCKQWTIEEFFRILRTGRRVEERRFGRGDDLREFFAFNAAAACRVFDIARAAKETPDVPAVDIVPEDAPEILKIVLSVNKMHPKAPEAPTIREFTVDLARIAGFQASKQQPLPGIQKLWSAWTDFAPQFQICRAMEADGIFLVPSEGD